MATSGLHHIALQTRDLQMTEKFYTQVVGLKVAFRVPPNMLFLRTPGSQDLVNFVKSKNKPARSGGLDHFGFRTTPARLRRLERKLKDNSVAIAGRRGKHAIYIQDPNGYSIEYYCD